MNKILCTLAMATGLMAFPALAAPDKPARGDANSDGIVTRAEMERLAATRFARLDINKDGRITSDDRSAQSDDDTAARRGKRAGHMGMGWMRADRDGDKAVSPAEFTAATLARFDRIDTDKDGNLTESERQAARDGRRNMGRKANPAPPSE